MYTPLVIANTVYRSFFDKAAESARSMFFLVRYAVARNVYYPLTIGMVSVCCGYGQIADHIGEYFIPARLIIYAFFTITPDQAENHS